MTRRIGVLVACVVLAAAFACRSQRVPVDRGVIDAALPTQFALTPLPHVNDELARSLVCADSLGRTAARFPTRRCLPCFPPRVQDGALEAIVHARTLWTRTGTAPWAADDSTARCIDLAWSRAALLARRDSAAARVLATPAVVVDRARFHAASAVPLTRQLAFDSLDLALAEHLAAGDSAWTREALELLARATWSHAQALLARPGWRLDVVEHQVQELPATMRWRVLPPLPPQNDTFGVAEAEWSARLFDRLATISTPASRHAWHRLALAPWVAMARWPSLDSAARALIGRAPGDSAVLPARALAAYQRMVRIVAQQPATDALFDSVLRALPNADAARYNAFDGVFTRADDAWRESFSPADRAQLDTRGWFVLDPLWTTTVNEVRLARRARMATADYLYADIAPPGTSGSATAAGRLLMRRGVPSARWSSPARTTAAPFLRLLGGWDGLRQVLEVEQTDETWRVFHGGRFTWARVATDPITADPVTARSVPCLQDGRDEGASPPPATFVECAERTRAHWAEVPFMSTLTAIDVVAARFRAGRDSTDIYLGASVPMTAFLPDRFGNPQRSAPLQLSAFLGTPSGERHWRQSEDRPRPTRDTRWRVQWSPRVTNGEWLHRVELLDADLMRGGRGAMAFTTTTASVQSMRGFGMSDLLVAADAKEARKPVRRWNDYAYEPNGGVVAGNTPFVVVWELYGLRPSSDGRLRWRVELRREQGAQVTRTDTRDVLLGAPRANPLVRANEPEAPELQYTREAPPADVIVDRLRIPLPAAATPGRHVLRVRVTDLVSGEVVERGVSVRLEASKP